MPNGLSARVNEGKNAWTLCFQIHRLGKFSKMPDSTSAAGAANYYVTGRCGTTYLINVIRQVKTADSGWENQLACRVSTALVLTGLANFWVVGISGQSLPAIGSRRREASTFPQSDFWAFKEDSSS
jgi:hypothetical protein